ncbi:hypothetical protein [Paenibacillus spongiae]|uniref:Holin n=1 Tax=Paenibacillus spongiae TaxID=2909671 RepID=A0ABY5SET7_9BACL|nr:hypothetical protein [Paenibacillus spongiae]UVI31225.1 hypothetical protein L1F29_05110 [Paenibacillus spongiae]
MSKYLDPKFIAGLIAMAAITLNRKFLWNLDEIELTASIGVTVNFIIVQLAEDIQKMKNGEKPSWNSTKLVTMFVACGIIGFTQYAGFELETEDVLWVAGIAAAVITGKGIKDIKEAKMNGVTPIANDVAKDYDYSGLDAEKTHSV